MSVIRNIIRRVPKESVRSLLRCLKLFTNTK